MRVVNVTSFRKNPAGQLARLSEGEEVLLTLRGKIIARLIPVSADDGTMKNRENSEPIEVRGDDAWRVLEGLRKTCSIGDVVSPLDEIWEVQNGCP